MLGDGTVKLALVTALVATLAIVCVNCTRSSGGGGGLASKAKDDHFHTFQRTYLMVYLPAMMADWLQGPYVYALYDSYGYSQGDNAVLFMAGFGSSAVFGTLVGSLADQMGRRKLAMFYCLLYGASCLTKHVNDFSVLMVGRITGGMATSLLFSVFDSWMVSEHNRRGFDPELLGSTFSLAVFSNSLVAIAAGEVGQLAADWLELTDVGGGVHYGGYCSPFDLAIVSLVVALLLMATLWSENFGQSGLPLSGGSLAGTVRLALQTLRTQQQVLWCGVVCALFEASMFIFVFMWTPGVTEEGAPKPPFGHIFATFMLMSMLGSQIYSMAARRYSAEEVGQGALFIAAASHAVPVVTGDAGLRFAAFLLFEVCVGIYFPMMGTMKGNLVPEESRSAIYNLYRVPLNIIVVGTLALKVKLHQAFTLTSVLLLVATLFQSKLKGLRRGVSAGPSEPVGVDKEFSLDGEMAIGNAGVPGEEDEELVTTLGKGS